MKCKAEREREALTVGITLLFIYGIFVCLMSVIKQGISKEKRSKWIEPWNECDCKWMQGVNWILCFTLWNVQMPKISCMSVLSWKLKLSMRHKKIKLSLTWNVPQHNSHTHTHLISEFNDSKSHYKLIVTYLFWNYNKNYAMLNASLATRTCRESIFGVNYDTMNWKKERIIITCISYISYI